MGRNPCCSKVGMNRGAWAPSEDKILTDYIKLHGEGNWRNLAKSSGLKRCGKSCRLRWLNYLRPDIKRGNITRDEEDLIIRLHKLLGNRWSLIAGRVPGRTDNEIKNYWNTILARKVLGHDHIGSSTRKASQKSDGNHQKEKSLASKDENILELQPAVRTKAAKCSKGLVLTTSRLQTAIDENFGKEQENSALKQSYISYTNTKNELSGQDQLLSLSTAEENNSSNFMLDFTSEDLNLTEFLNSEFSGYCDLMNQENGTNMMHIDWTSPTPDDPLIFCDDILENWTTRND